MKLSNRPTSSLKQNYLLRFETALIIMLATFIGLFKLQLPEKNIDDVTWTIPKQGILHLESMVATHYAPEKPAAPPPVYVPNPPPEHEIIEEQLQNLGVKFALSDPIPMPTAISRAEQEKIVEENSILPIENRPRLIGGLEKLQRSISYPPDAVEDGVEGRVIIEFIVDKKGKVRNPKILKGVRGDINREALKAISKAQFLPARQKGKAIPIEQVIFILFKLDNSS